MILEHVAAILLFSGPFFYIGMWMALDPAGIANLPRLLVRVFRSAVQSFSGIHGPVVEPAPVEIPRRVKITLRLTGLALLLFALVV
jgi:hypothetical protein